jgi:hypothetical protein
MILLMFVVVPTVFLQINRTNGKITEEGENQHLFSFGLFH